MDSLFNGLIINCLYHKKDFQEKVDFFLKEWLSCQKTVQVQTSGSTGKPKILEIEKEKMLNSAKMTCDFLGLKASETALVCLPMEYISGKMMIVRGLERNLNLLLVQPTIMPLKSLDTNVDFCAMTPLQVENSLDKIHLLKNLIIGGAAVSDSLKMKIKQVLSDKKIGNRIFETYGMSETLSHIALKKIFPIQEDYFTVLDDVKISQDERNCLVVFAPKLNDNLLVTNDIVELKNEKQFRFLGRWDNVINSGGAKIFPEELEQLVKKEILNEIVFLGVPDEVLGEKLVLVVEEPMFNGDLEMKIKNIEYKKSFHKPKEILSIPEFPRTPNGKINRLEIKSIVQEMLKIL